MKKSGTTKDFFSGNNLQVTAFTHEFANPKERQEFLMNLAISSEFDMRHRGLLQYYGKDFIAYKREKPSDHNRNEFLRVISKFMANCLEDNCPPSWQQCQSAFWEELIFTFFPHSMKITPNEKEVETFLFQLKKFVRWLDRRTGTSWYSVVEKFAREAGSELTICEWLLNALFLNDFPRIHHSDWNRNQDIEKVHQKFNQCSDKLDSIFEVTSRIEDTVVLTEFDTNRTYYIKGLPSKLIETGIIMSGMIGKRRGELVWNWFQTEGIYPQRGKKYLALKTNPESN
ncbi:hypothetical protein V7161_03265 [Neobacillus drentensis]|uniref:hypothetical protein n=1 Tax=Neobacillus drentensis TaxID=220684 RepID=UPI002FFDB333